MHVCIEASSTRCPTNSMMRPSPEKAHAKSGSTLDPFGAQDCAYLDLRLAGTRPNLAKRRNAPDVPRTAHTRWKPRPLTSVKGAMPAF